MPSVIRLKTQEASDLGTVPAGRVDIFVDDDTLEPSYKIPAGTVLSLVGAAGPTGPTGPGVADFSGVRVYRATTQSISSGVDTAISFSNRDADYADLGYWAIGSPDQLVVPAGLAGPYLIFGAAQFRNGSGQRLIYVLKDGTDIQVPVHNEGGSSGDPHLVFATVRYLAEGDTLQMMAYQDSGTAKDIEIGSEPGFYVPSFGMVLMRGAKGDTGATGSAGGPIALQYTFSTTTTDADPGNGNLRLNNATQGSATAIRADLLDTGGATVTAILDSLDDSTNTTVKGHIRLFKTSDPTKWILFTVSGVGSETGYRNITVVFVAQSGVNPFANSDVLTLAFERAGDKGADGAGSGTLTTIEEADGTPTDSAVTKLVFPNGTLGIAANVATYTAAPAGRSTLGTTSAGASFETTRRVYMKKVTVPSGGRWLQSVHAFVKGNAANSVAMSAAVMSDSAGTPVLVVATGGSIQKESDSTSLTNLGMSATVRDVSVSLARFLTAGDWWLCVAMHAAADSRIQLAKTASTGTDRTQAATAFCDHSFVATAATTDDFSIYGEFLA
jgi:hypothetical protein